MNPGQAQDLIVGVAKLQRQLTAQPGLSPLGSDKVPQILTNGKGTSGQMHRCFNSTDSSEPSGREEDPAFPSHRDNTEASSCQVTGNRCPSRPTSTSSSTFGSSFKKPLPSLRLR